MHDAARNYIASFAAPLCFVRKILEIGGRDINGGLRDLWPRADWVAVDIFPGPGVDVVADFTTYDHPEPVELIICCEVFEHTPHWPDLIAAARRNLDPYGVLLITTATGNRKPHSGVDGNELRPGEHYANINPKDLIKELNKHFTHVQIDLKGADVRARAQTLATYDCHKCNTTNILADQIKYHQCEPGELGVKRKRREGRTSR